MRTSRATRSGAAPARGEIPFEAGKQLAERALTARASSRMNVCPDCGVPGPVRGVRRQRVAFQSRPPGRNARRAPRRRQTAHTGADDNSLLTDKVWGAIPVSGDSLPA